MSQHTPSEPSDHSASSPPSGLSAATDTPGPAEAVAIASLAWRPNMAEEAEEACVRELAQRESTQAASALRTYLRPNAPFAVLDALANILPAEVMAQTINVLTIPAVLLELQTSYNGPFKFGPYIHDLAPLADLSDLQTLYFTRTPITDVTPLAGLYALRELSLDNTQVRDVTPLNALHNLQWLSLHNTRVSDLSPLAGLHSLKTLYLDYTSITDVTPLAGLSNLQCLFLNNTPVRDFTPLAGLTGLQTLYLNSAQIRDLTPLGGLHGLQSLHLDATPITDLTPLEGLSNLVALALHGTGVSDAESQRFVALLRSRGQDIEVYSAERE